MYLNKSRKFGGGFTLTEAAIVLGIVGLILGAIWVAAASVYNNLRVSRATEELLQSVQSIRSLYATQSVVDFTNEVALISAGVFPNDMVNADGDGLINPWGEAVTVAPNGSDTTEFVITFTVPNKACTDFLVRNTGQGRDTGLIQAGSNTDFPVTVTEAVDFCGSATTVEVPFTFRLKG